MTLHARQLGSVRYREALEVQRAMFECTDRNYLLLLEHPNVFTMGVRDSSSHMLVDPTSVNAELVQTDRGGDITFHGPGQLVGYLILSLNAERDSTRVYVSLVEQLLMDSLGELGLTDTFTQPDRPGVWVRSQDSIPLKLAAIGVRRSRGRTMHGFALNVSTDLAMFDRIVACGNAEAGVTSLQALGIPLESADAVEVISRRASEIFDDGTLERAAVTPRRSGDVDLAAFSRGLGAGEAVRYQTKRHAQPVTEASAPGTSVRLLGRLAQAGVNGGVEITDRKPEWMRAPVRLDAAVRATQRAVRSNDLVTVCQEAGCPNLSECWADGTATFMVCGERCTRACGFCLVDTHKPAALDPGEPTRVAQAVADMALRYAVITMVARDDLADGGARHVAETIRAIHDLDPGIAVEALISDLGGDYDGLDIVCEAQPEVLNHNIETVARLQRAARPSAGYARSLGVLAHARARGLTTKSGIVVGMGETFDEVVGVLGDLAAVGVSIVTIGQYLRPTTHHLPVAQWWSPSDFAEWKRIGELEFGFDHVESSPLTRSSYHARSAMATASSRSRAEEQAVTS